MSIDGKPPAFDLDRKTWTSFNRAKTNHGRYRYKLHTWRKSPVPICDGGEADQTIRHITQECKLRAYDGNSSDFPYAAPESIEYIKKLDVRLGKKFFPHLQLYLHIHIYIFYVK